MTTVPPDLVVPPPPPPPPTLVLVLALPPANAFEEEDDLTTMVLVVVVLRPNDSLLLLLYVVVFSRLRHVLPLLPLFCAVLLLKVDDDTAPNATEEEFITTDGEVSESTGISLLDSSLLPVVSDKIAHQ
eukprot:GFYU01028116.1.p2 GENE.GFYU01028116.1~~GFYU01028116.1.p2  ORF type:complete len:129 (-),score=8.21 GFYU01028116.1:780-1166(-)